MTVIVEITPMQMNPFDIELEYNFPVSDGSWSCLPGHVYVSDGYFYVSDGELRLLEFDASGLRWLLKGAPMPKRVATLSYFDDLLQLVNESAGPGAVMLPSGFNKSATWRVKSGAPLSRLKPLPALTP